MILPVIAALAEDPVTLLDSKPALVILGAIVPFAVWLAKWYFTKPVQDAGVTKAGAETSRTEAEERKLAAETLRDVQNDIHKWFKDFNHLAEDVRKLENTSDRRYRLLRAIVLDMSEALEDDFTGQANCKEVMSRIHEIKDRFRTELDKETVIYETDSQAKLP